MFVFEALRAKHGDSLLIHHGSSDAPAFVLIDGGPGGVYRQTLKPRLEALRDELDPGLPLEIGLVMISHIDHDHIDGIIDLFTDMKETHADHEQPLVSIGSLWNNSFNEIIPDSNNNENESSAMTLSSLHDNIMLGEVDGCGHSKLVLQSVREGITLRDLARFNHIDVNADFDNGIVLDSGIPVEHEGLKIQVLGPSLQQVTRLQKRWHKESKKLAEDDQQAKLKAAEYLDSSVFNLSSIVTLIQQGGSTILSTGDARGDFILKALEKAKLFDDSGVFKVDVLKLPHHGSDRNIEKDFFEKVIAKHYVVSGNGRHHNPEANTFKMLFDVRSKGAPYTVHLTYGVDEFKNADYAKEVQETFRKAEEEDVPVSFNIAQPGTSIVIEL